VPDKFNSLEDFLSEFEENNDSGQIKKLQEILKPMMLR
jgi:hypothetical protein